MKGKKTERTSRRNVEFLLKRSGMTVDQLAQRSGLSIRGINYIRSGQRSPTEDTLDAIAQVFGLTNWHLLNPNLDRDIENQEWLDRIRGAFTLTNPAGQELLMSAVRAAESMKPEAPPQPETANDAAATGEKPRSKRR